MLPSYALRGQVGVGRNLAADRNEPYVNVIQPNFLNKHWGWVAYVGDRSMKGRANSEPEAWRLGNDAIKQMNKSTKD
jgi:hypothetical protein